MTHDRQRKHRNARRSKPLCDYCRWNEAPHPRAAVWQLHIQDEPLAGYQLCRPCARHVADAIDRTIPMAEFFATFRRIRRRVALSGAGRTDPP